MGEAERVQLSKGNLGTKSKQEGTRKEMNQKQLQDGRERKNHHWDVQHENLASTPVSLPVVPQCQ